MNESASQILSFQNELLAAIACVATSAIFFVTQIEFHIMTVVNVVFGAVVWIRWPLFVAYNSAEAYEVHFGMREFDLRFRSWGSALSLKIQI